jgi:hypothetical protein
MEFRTTCNHSICLCLFFALLLPSIIGVCTMFTLSKVLTNSVALQPVPIKTAYSPPGFPLNLLTLLMLIARLKGKEGQYFVTSIHKRETGIHTLPELQTLTLNILTTKNTTDSNCIIPHATPPPKKDCTSAKCIFKCTTSVTGHKHRTADFPQCKKKTVKVNCKLLIQYQYLVCLLYDNKLFLNQYACGLLSLLP